MWPFKKENTIVKKEKSGLNPCPNCKSDEAKFTSRGSDYFHYRLEIKCESCQLELTKYGNHEQPLTPEIFSTDWKNFINSWNNMSTPELPEQKND